MIRSLHNILAKVVATAVPVIAGAACSTDPSDAPAVPGSVKVIMFDDVRDSKVTTTLNITDFRISAYTGEYKNKVVMENVMVTRTGLNSWSYSPEVEWPGTPVDFYAVSPASVKADYNPYWRHCINYINRGDEDLLVGVKINAEQSGHRLRINFRHALCMVSVRLRTSLPDDTEVRVRRVALRDMGGQSRLFFPDYTTELNQPDSLLTGLWEVWNVTTDYPLYEVEPYVVLTSEPLEASNLGVRYMVPVQLEPLKLSPHLNGSSISIVYRLVDKATGRTLWPDASTDPGLLWYDDRSWGESRVAVDKDIPDGRWLCGMHYRYTVDVCGPASYPSASRGVASPVVDISSF